MVDQTKVAPSDGTGDSAPRDAARNVAELLHDVLLLSELQGKLLAVELKQEVQKSIMPLVVLACGAVLALSCLPLALVCVALAVEELTPLGMALSFTITVAVAIVVAVFLVLGSAWYMRRSIRLLERSRLELSLNMRWVRGVLRRLGGSRRRARFGAETAYRW